MKKTFIYSLVVATLLVGCGDKEGSSIAESVKSAASGAVEKTKEVAKEVSDKAVDAAKEAGNSAVEAVKNGENVVDAAKNAVSNAAANTIDSVKDATNVAVESAKDAGIAVSEKVFTTDTDTDAKAEVEVAAVVATAKNDVNETIASATDSAAGKAAFAKCVACHGVNAEKKALGTSQVVAGWDASKTEAALKGYKDGSYGGAMKGVMKGQVVSMSDADIASVSAYISTLK